MVDELKQSAGPILLVFDGSFLLVEKLSLNVTTGSAKFPTSRAVDGEITIVSSTINNYIFNSIGDAWILTTDKKIRLTDIAMYKVDTNNTTHEVYIDGKSITVSSR